jgi:hypothetical protein
VCCCYCDFSVTGMICVLLLFVCFFCCCYCWCGLCVIFVVVVLYVLLLFLLWFVLYWYCCCGFYVAAIISCFPIYFWLSIICLRYESSFVAGPFHFNTLFVVIIQFWWHYISVMLVSVVHRHSSWPADSFISLLPWSCVTLVRCVQRVIMAMRACGYLAIKVNLLWLSSTYSLITNDCHAGIIWLQGIE